MPDDVLRRRTGQVGRSSQPSTQRAHAKDDYVRIAFLAKSKNLIGHRAKLDRNSRDKFQVPDRSGPGRGKEKETLWTRHTNFESWHGGLRAEQALQKPTRHH